MMHLNVGLTRAAVGFIDANLAQYFAGLKRGRQQMDEEIVRFDRAVAVLAPRYDFCVQGNHRRRPITSWTRVGYSAADRAVVPVLEVAECAGAFGPEWTNSFA